MKRWILCGLALMSALFCGTTFGAEEAVPSEQYVIYYPHTTFRCLTCNTIESLTRAAVEGGEATTIEGKKVTMDNAPLAAPVKANRLVFRSVNIEEEGNATLIYELKTKAKLPAIAQVVNGKIVRAQPLEQAWKLVSKPQDYAQYVQSEAQKFMKAK